LESHKSISELQSQVTSYAKQTERLERHRAILLGQEREREERDKAKKDEGEKEMEGLKAELRSTRKELGGLKDRYEELNASFLDLEHEAEQAAAEVRAGEETVEGLERELEQMRADVEHITEGYEDERKKGEALKAVVEKMKMEQSRGVDAEVIREELHRESPSALPRTYSRCEQDKLPISRHSRRRTPS
jgi:chromosome segregation ATPase